MAITKEFQEKKSIQKKWLMGDYVLRRSIQKYIQSIQVYSYELPTVILITQIQPCFSVN